ncbi:ABC transporter ATP-binding protein [Bradyrhizobium sp. CCGB12]|uniref:ABC transporter ATP-binding protein n=1 Tax=Bradyrhizobium sp. CCGB12 TaxID=2949632 RepID=UPI0020B37EED|nr:ABC transporter ATP-binding protein [Bradyrhizobium sp. CCGB12]MCP3387878.1 ABC transporter ATP-binding protein [Bradyrhizobium sp. CCGB12]
MNVAPRLTALAGNSAPPALLELDHVSISYPTPDGILTAVEDVSFRISAGERLVLLGPSGCGKSTLLRAVGGFLKPSAGELRMTGRRIGAPGPDRMTVFQEFDQLLPWRTVLGNVRYALERGKSMPRRDAEGVARRWLERVGLKNFVDAFPHTLSGGMKQRVAIARAFALEPTLLLMDEPFAALDALTRRQMQDELLRLCEETGNTALFVTHGIDEAIRVGTRILALTPHPGRLAATFDVPLAARARGTAGFAELERQIQETVFSAPESEHV